MHCCLWRGRWVTCSAVLNREERGNPLQFLRNCDRASSDRHALTA